MFNNMRKLPNMSSEISTVRWARNWEFAVAGRFADRQCERFGGRAAFVSVARGIATFRCEQIIFTPPGQSPERVSA
jgi:hypothetical protein